MTQARILVVDDDDGGRYVKSHALRRQGFAVSEAGFVQMAMESITESTPDLVLLDVRLPDGDGVDLCRRIKTQFPSVAVLQTSSALISPQDRAEALLAGADSYLVEPIEPDELVAVVKALLRMRQAEQELRRMNEALAVKLVQGAGELAETNRQLATEQAGRRQAEDILWHTQKLEAVGQLTGGIAHDFNNLLTIITGNLELLQGKADDQPPLTERHQRLIGAALKAAEHGAQMTQQLLAFARRGVLHSKTLNLNTTVAGMEDFLRRTLGEAIILQFARTPDLWLCDIDPVQFEAALINLAINSRDAMPNGGELRVELDNVDLGAKDAEAMGLLPGQYVCARVADTGSGMPPDVAERAFEPFFTTKNIGKGSGLGLSQVYGYVTQSGGTATITSAPKRGTAISLYLPRSRMRSAEREDGHSSVQLRSPGKETILVVEDDADVRETAVAIIQDLGYETLVATNAVEALSLLRDNDTIDLLFSDVMMPGGVNGHNLAAQALSIQGDLKILLASGYPAHSLADGEPSKFPIIQKPYRRDRLAATLRSALSVS